MAFSKGGTGVGSSSGGVAGGSAEGPAYAIFPISSGIAIANVGATPARLSYGAAIREWGGGIARATGNAGLTLAAGTYRIALAGVFERTDGGSGAAPRANLRVLIENADGDDLDDQVAVGYLRGGADLDLEGAASDHILRLSDETTVTIGIAEADQGSDNPTFATGTGGRVTVVRLVEASTSTADIDARIAAPARAVNPSGRFSADRIPTIEDIANALDAFIGDADWRGQLSGQDLVDAIDSATGSNVWRTSHTALRTAQEVRDLLDGLLGTGWRTGGGGSSSGGGITLEQATDAAGALLATLGQFTYDASSNTLAFTIPDNSITAAQARATSAAHKNEWLTRIGAAALTGATFTGPVSGLTPTLSAHLATKAYVDSMTGPAPMPGTDDFVFGLSADSTPEAAEGTIAAPGGSAQIGPIANQHILIFRLTDMGDITRVVFSDDPSSANQAAGFLKWGSEVRPSIEVSGDYSVWVSRFALTRSRATMVVS